MSLSRSQDQIVGWLCSAIAHMAFLIIVLLVMVPAGNHLARSLELVMAPQEEPIAEVVILDLSQGQSDLRKQTHAGDAAQEVTVQPLEVAHPFTASNNAVRRHDGTAGIRAGANRGQQANFFGIDAQGDRFLFIVDISRSMRKDRRLPGAIAELQRSIAQLRDDQQFGVVLFSDGPRKMFDERELGLVRATSENKSRLTEWLRAVEPLGGTNPRESLVIALRMAPSAIFVLSDGAFDAPEPASGFFGTPEPEVSMLIRDHNKAQTPIHTIAFADPSSKENMAEIASLTGGRFRFVTKDQLASREDKAAGLLRLAENHKAFGELELASRYYARILSEYPKSQAAAEVRSLQSD
jgi:hypothetical protein